jgi:hypothetical protein
VSYPVLETEDRSLRVRFDPGFGLNVYIESWAMPCSHGPKEPVLRESVGMSIQGWERICEMVHKYESAHVRTPEQ